MFELTNFFFLEKKGKPKRIRKDSKVNELVPVKKKSVGEGPQIGLKKKIFF